jgi:hypothetical protein
MRSNALPSSGSGAVLGLNRALESNERRLIEKALKECNGRVFGPLGAATRLGIPSSTLESKIRRHGKQAPVSPVGLTRAVRSPHSRRFASSQIREISQTLGPLPIEKTRKNTRFAGTRLGVLRNQGDIHHGDQ